MLKTIRRIITILVLGFIASLLYQLVQQNQRQLAVDDSAPLIVQQLRAVQRLETAEMSVTKILKGEQELADRIPGIDRDNMVSDFLFGESVSMEIYGTVSAGFDLSQINTGAIINVGSGVVDIQLPAPTILRVSLDPETQVFDRDLGLLNKGDQNTETKLRNQAIDIVRDAALDQGILDEATTNANAALQKILGADVTIRQILILPRVTDDVTNQ